MLSSAATAASMPCSVTLKDANVWNGTSYAKQTLTIKDGRFAETDPTVAAVDFSALYLIPPFADAHTHYLDTPGANDARHAKAIAKGVFFALNPNNIRPDGAAAAALPGEVELQAAGGGVTKPGGHPEPLYAFLAKNGWLGPVGIADLPGKAFHHATTPAEARAAVAKVKANGAAQIKLYLLDHDKPSSGGLSAEVFDAAAAEARKLGLRPIVHVENAADFRRAVAARVHAIVHLPYSLSNGRRPEAMKISPADAEAAAKERIIVVPTVTVALAANDGAKLRAIQDAQRFNLSALRAAGVRMAVGADSFSLDMHDEIMTLRGLGIFEASDVITMATTNGVELAFPDRKLGRLEPGYEASFIAWFQPLPGNWGNMREPVLGMRGGQTLLDTVNWLTKICPVPASPAK